LRYLVRDQEVEGSNPFAPTTSKTLPFNGLRYFFNFTFHSSLCANVDQFKAEPDPLGAFLTEPSTTSKASQSAPTSASVSISGKSLGSSIAMTPHSQETHYCGRSDELLFSNDKRASHHFARGSSANGK
jgi:hypothetical protein